MTHDPDFHRPDPNRKDASPESAAATSSLIWGILAMGLWLLPPVGLLAALAGLVLGHRGWNAPNGDRARLGVVLSAIALLLAAWLAAWVFVATRNPNF